METISINAQMWARRIEPVLRARLRQNPAVVLLGPRQAGKTTLARALERPGAGVYLDLESPEDRLRLEDARSYLEAHAGKLVILDEVHRVPELFAVLRGVLDERRRSRRPHGHLLLLGSAAMDLLRQAGESLAGRVAFVELDPLDVGEVGAGQLEKLWLRGGFPRSFLAAGAAGSLQWRRDFIRTYLERDVPQFGIRVPAETLRRFWTMLAHGQGQILNAARLASSLGVDGKTVAHYLDLLVDLLLVRRLPAWHRNSGKRLVKSPKVYVRDSGLVHALLGLETREDLLGHPVAGPSWEGMVLEYLLHVVPAGTEASYYRSATGHEIDLVLQFPGKKGLWAVECKRSRVPRPEKGFYLACQDLRPSRRWVVYPGRERFSLGQGVEAISALDLGELAGQCTG